jgi:hypothetical protein
LKALSERTRVPQQVYLREGLEYVLEKYSKKGAQKLYAQTASARQLYMYAPAAASKQRLAISKSGSAPRRPSNSG